MQRCLSAVVEADLKSARDLSSVVLRSFFVEHLNCEKEKIGRCCCCCCCFIFWPKFFGRQVFCCVCKFSFIYFLSQRMAAESIFCKYLQKRNVCCNRVIWSSWNVNFDFRSCVELLDSWQRDSFSPLGEPRPVSVYFQYSKHKLFCSKLVLSGHVSPVLPSAYLPQPSS